eukprot:777339_1
MYDVAVLNEIRSRQQKALLDIANDEEDLAKTLKALPFTDYATDGATLCSANPSATGCATNAVVETLYECIAAKEKKCLLIDSWMKQLEVVLPPYWTNCAQPWCGAGAIEIDRVPCANTAYVKCAQCLGIFKEIVDLVKN